MNADIESITHVSVHLLWWPPLTLLLDSLADSVNGARHDDKSSRCREFLSLERSQHPENDGRRCERHEGPTWRAKRLACHRDMACPQPQQPQTTNEIQQQRA